MEIDRLEQTALYTFSMSLSPISSASAEASPTPFEQLRSFEIFKSCSDEFVSTLAQFATYRTIKSGQLILNEGALNDQLRILASGEVEVRVNGERVAIMNQPGDLMGEISALAGRQVTASLKAKTDLSFFEMDSSELGKKIKSAPADFGYQLYAVLAQQLSDKIIATNEKARQFEIANRALDEINKNLDRKVQERTDASFKQLSELQASLTPLQTLLKTIGSTSQAGQKSAVDEAAALVANAVEMLKPISELYSSERAMRSRNVLIAEPDRKQQTITRMALGGTGAKLEATTTADECLAALGVSTDLVPAIKTSAPQAKLVYMVGSDLAEEIVTLKKLAPLLSNIVSRHTSDRMFTVKNIATTVTKLISQDLFGLEKYMMWGVQTHSHPITRSNERSELISSMEDQMKSLGVRSAITDRASAVAEELLMNAIYDAPADQGVHHYAALPRTQKVELKASEQGQFRYAVDGMLAAISVSDPFGGFKMETLLNYLEKNAQSDGSNLQEPGKGGAGRGLQQIISNSDLVVFNVQAGVRTEVIAFFNLDPSLKDSSPRSFHFFSEL